MLSMLYRASFFLYEISFILFAGALFLQGAAMKKLTKSLGLPSVSGYSWSSGVLLILCAAIHFYVYHTLSPQYLQTSSFSQLILMYALKTFSMVSILAAGLCLALGNWLYLKKTR